MKIIIASSGHKEFLSPKESSEIIGNAISHKNIISQILPISDGGDGFIDVLVDNYKGIKKKVSINDPLSRKRLGEIGLIHNNKTAVIEIAEAAGSALLKNHERQTMIATSYGVGELIKKSYDFGCRNFYIGLGGSIVSDCGIGLAQALGIEFFDKNNNILKPIVGIGLNALSLNLIHSFSTDKIKIDLNKVKIKVASDSDIFLTGKKGQAITFGPQKGCSRTEIFYLDQGYKNIAKIFYENKKINIDVPYAGAAGGMGAALLGFLNAELISGAEFISDQIDFHNQLLNSDILIVSEGKLDISTLSNKAPFYFANIAKSMNKKVVCIAGKSEINLDVFDKIYTTEHDKIILKKSAIKKNLTKQSLVFLKDLQNGVFDEKNK